jgi:hypothetical protein
MERERADLHIAADLIEELEGLGFSGLAYRDDVEFDFSSMDTGSVESTADDGKWPPLDLTLDESERVTEKEFIDSWHVPSGAKRMFSRLVRRARQSADDGEAYPIEFVRDQDDRTVIVRSSIGKTLEMIKTDGPLEGLGDYTIAILKRLHRDG